MPYLHQYDYIFGIGTVFAMLDAYNNGASEYTYTLSGLQWSMAFSTVPIPVLIDILLFFRRCSQLLGDQCVLPVHLLPSGHGSRHHL